MPPPSPQVLQAALDNLVRRGTFPAQKLSLSHVESWVAALSLPADQLAGWGKDRRGYALKHLTSLIMTLGAHTSIL